MANQQTVRLRQQDIHKYMLIQYMCVCVCVCVLPSRLSSGQPLSLSLCINSRRAK